MLTYITYIKHIKSMEIVKENGKYWGVEKMEMYGVIHYGRILLGEYEDEPQENSGEEKKTKKTKRKKNPVK